MHLPDTLRQIAAGLGAGAAFAGFYLGAGMLGWVAFALALAVYGALLLLIAPSPDRSLIRLGERVSAADLDGAFAALGSGENRLRRAAAAAPERDRPSIAAMADELAALRRNLQTDPDDFRGARRFIAAYLPHMLVTVENYVALAARAEDNPRILSLSQGIAGFLPPLRRVNQACLENDFLALEAEVSALEIQMKRE